MIRFVEDEFKIGLFVLETDPEGFLTEGISSSESVLSTCTDARGISIHGQINRGVFESNSTTSEAVGLFVAVICQHDFSNVSLVSTKNCQLMVHFLH